MTDDVQGCSKFISKFRGETQADEVEVEVIVVFCFNQLEDSSPS
jgi:hypothetical protein